MKKNLNFLTIVSLFLAIVMIGCRPSETAVQENSNASNDNVGQLTSSNLPETINIDFVSSNPLALIAKDQGLMEEEFKNDKININWVRTFGGGKSMEFMRSGSIDFSGVAGLSELTSFINGNKLRMIYILNTDESSLMAAPKSDIKEVKDLKGKNVAAAPNTNPYLIMVRAFDEAGLDINDVNIIPLQHPEGLSELMRGRVDAWAGHDPLQTTANLGGAKYLFKDVSTQVVLSVREEFLQQYPDVVKRVLKVFEQARKWAIEHNKEYTDMVAASNKISTEVAEIMLETLRVDIDPDPKHMKPLLMKTKKALVLFEVIKEDTDLEKIIDEMIDSGPVQSLK